MMLRELFVLIACTAFAAAAKSPQAEYVKQMIKSGVFQVDPRFVDDILEDASLDVVSFKHVLYTYLRTVEMLFS